MGDVGFSTLITSCVIMKDGSNPEDWTKPGELQKEAQERFPTLVRNSNLNFYSRGDRISPSGERYLIGVATYSLIEMYILDALNERMKNRQRVTIDVFDLDSCATKEELAEYVPNARGTASPALGIWIDGEFTKSLEGGAANSYLREYFQLDSILQKLTLREGRVRRELEKLINSRRTGFVGR